MCPERIERYKYAISLKCLNEEVSNEGDFLHVEFSACW